MNLSEEHLKDDLDWLKEMKQDLKNNLTTKKSFYNFDFENDSITPGSFNWRILKEQADPIS
jgi:hypothetical protein